MSSQLASLVDDLCAAFAEERTAIAALDHTRIEELASRKHALAGEMVSLCDRSPESRLLVERVRIEARANALLAQMAGDAIRSLLGIDTNGYDRRAKPITSQMARIRVTY